MLSNSGVASNATEILKTCRFFLAAVRPGKLVYQPSKAFHKTKTIFVHIPKTAGTSIIHSLYGYTAVGHSYLRDFQIWLPAWVLQRYFKLSFVRNPWDRLYSAYRYLKAGGMGKIDMEFADQHLSLYQGFEEFVCSGALENSAISSYLHFIPMHKFLLPQPGKRLQMDFIGLYENLAEDFAFVRQKLRIDTPLAHRNRTGTLVSNKDYREIYTGKMIDIVGSFYAKDIQTFGYDFDNSSLPQQLSRRVGRRFPYGLLS